MTACDYAVFKPCGVTGTLQIDIISCFTVEAFDRIFVCIVDNNVWCGVHCIKIEACGTVDKVVYDDRGVGILPSDNIANTSGLECQVAVCNARLGL